jgi:hypothetical protein
MLHKSAYVSETKGADFMEPSKGAAFHAAVPPDTRGCILCLNGVGCADSGGMGSMDYGWGDLRVGSVRFPTH